MVGLLWFFVRGVKGRRVDGYEYCRGCGYCLEGLDGPGACVECGVVLIGDGAKKGAVFVGRRVWRKWCFLWGVLCLGFCLLIGIGGQLVGMSDKPMWWLIWELGSLEEGEGKYREVLWEEIEERYKRDGFSSDVDGLFDLAIEEVDKVLRDEITKTEAEFANSKGDGSLGLVLNHSGRLVKWLWRDGLLDAAQKEKYLKETISLRLVGKRRVSQGFSVLGIDLERVEAGGFFYQDRTLDIVEGKILRGFTPLVVDVTYRLKKLKYGGRELWDEKKGEVVLQREAIAVLKCGVGEVFRWPRLWTNFSKNVGDMKLGDHEMALLVEYEVKDRFGDGVFKWEEVVRQKVSLVDHDREVVDIVKDVAFFKRLCGRLREGFLWRDKIKNEETGKFVEKVGFGIVHFYEGDAYIKKFVGNNRSDWDKNFLEDLEKFEYEFDERLSKIDVYFDIYVISEDGSEKPVVTREFRGGNQYVKQSVMSGLVKESGVGEGLLRLASDLPLVESGGFDIILRANIEAGVRFGMNKKVWGGDDIVINGVVVESEPAFE